MMVEGTHYSPDCNCKSCKIVNCNKPIKIMKKYLVLKNGLKFEINQIIENQLSEIMNSNEHRKLEIDGNEFSNFQIDGIFTKDKLEELNKIHNGMWKCKDNEWHDRFKKCECHLKHEADKRQRQKEAYEKCSKCDDGGILINENGQDYIMECECIKNIK